MYLSLGIEPLTFLFFNPLNSGGPLIYSLYKKILKYLGVRGSTPKLRYMIATYSLFYSYNYRLLYCLYPNVSIANNESIPSIIDMLKSTMCLYKIQFKSINSRL